MILAHSTDSVTAMSMLQQLHTTICLRWLQVDLCGKSIKMSFCPFCAYVGANNLSYLNHIIIVHYNTSYGCGKCLKQALMSSSALHNHKKVCLGFDKKSTTGSDGKPSSGGRDNNSKMVAPPGQCPRSILQRLQLPTPRAPVPLWPHR